jgi:NAD-dependent DNA ligase
MHQEKAQLESALRSARSTTANLEDRIAQMAVVTQERDRLMTELQSARDNEIALQDRMAELSNLQPPAIAAPAPDLVRQIESLTQERAQMSQGLQEASQVVNNLEQQVKTLQREKGELEEAMKMARDVVTYLEQQVKDLSSVPQQTAASVPVSPAEEATQPLPSESTTPTPQSPPDRAVPTQSVASAQAKSNKPLEGQIFVITGTFTKLSFDQVKTLIEEAGGRINSMPSSKTNYAIVGQNPGNKLAKAEKHGIPQLTETQLMELLGI